MTLFLSIAALAVYSILVILDFRLSNGNRDSRFCLRVISCSACMFLIVGEHLFDTLPEMSELTADVFVGDAILLMFPCSFEKPDVSLKFSLAIMAVSVILFFIFSVSSAGWIRYRHQRLVWTSSAILSLCFGYAVAVAVRKFQGIRSLFRSSAVWQNVEDYSRFMCSIVFLGICIMTLASFHVPGDPGVVYQTISFSSLMAFFVFLYVKAFTGRSYLVSKEKEVKIKEMIKGNLRTVCIDKVDEDQKMTGLYKRIMDYMTAKQPYLDSSFSMSELADKLFSNKLYLSRTINVQSGRNFRQFVNYHRIQYALELMKQDPRLRVSEVSEMSGFHSVVSFNMAFKINTGQTPSDWMRDYLSRREYNL